MSELEPAFADDVLQTLGAPLAAAALWPKAPGTPLSDLDPAARRADELELVVNLANQIGRPGLVPDDPTTAVYEAGEDLPYLFWRMDGPLTFGLAARCMNGEPGPVVLIRAAKAKGAWAERIAPALEALQPRWTALLARAAAGAETPDDAKYLTAWSHASDVDPTYEFAHFVSDGETTVVAMSPLVHTRIEPPQAIPPGLVQSAQEPLPPPPWQT